MPPGEPDWIQGTKGYNLKEVIIMSDSKKLKQCPGCLHHEETCRPREWEGIKLDEYCNDCFRCNAEGLLLVGGLTATDQDRLLDKAEG